ncbi:hypothetical protein Tcan_00066 [Toxocara canis]|uniref:Uncharacterized protein n=1 Tax=Toxocara canis TaxID=6265 RepID=A0A0B2VJX4_TOXCA|nr:hypothetical protein Tcan_00066 [Toxocara canis]
MERAEQHSNLSSLTNFLLFPLLYENGFLIHSEIVMCNAFRSQLLPTLYCASVLAILATVFARADAQSLGKPCSSSFHCWRTEPVDDNGIPLALTGSISKRLEIGGSIMKGGRCRCKDGACQFYIFRSQTALACEEF